MRYALCVFVFVAAGVGTGGLSRADEIVFDTAIEQLDASKDTTQCCERDCCPPRWTVSVDAIALTRNMARDRTLATAGASGPEVLNVRDLDFDWSVNPRLSAVRHGQRWDLELVYFQVDGWRAHGRVDDPGALVFTAPGLTATVVGGGVVYDYTSRLHNTELNFRRPLNDCVTFVTGFRWVELHEQFTGGGVSGSTALGDYWSANLDNHLYGWQVGADAALWNRGGPLRIDAQFRAGIFSNESDQDTTVPLVNNIGASARRTNTAGLVELNFVGTYQLTKRLAMRAGYQLLWIDGLALAPNQIDVTNVATGVASMDTRGTLFAHGALLGLEAKF